MSAVVIDNAAWPDAAPALSVLIPCYRDDPTPLLAALDRPGLPAEVVLLDDGSGDSALAARMEAAIRGLAVPARLIRLAANEGRARGRNRLARAARADRLLFLDADMLPDHPDFLDRWLALVEAEDPPVAFGGFSLDQAPEIPEHAVHRAMALKGDCLPAAARRLEPQKTVFTSNLLVRRDLIEAEPFDGGFVGWGWEDVEWTLRVSRRWPIRHVDITATHLGLDPVPVMAAKYEQSAANFARMAATHGEVVKSYPSYRAAQALRRAPFLKLWRGWPKAAALFEPAPVPLRAFSLRLYRAALYAEAIG